MKYQAPYGSADPNAPYVDRDTPGAIKGSAVPAAAIEDPQRELAALIAAGGLTPDDADLVQVAKAIQAGKINYAVAGGTANALTATLAPVPAALVVGLKINVAIASSNTGAATINVNGLGAKSITNNGAALVGGELVAGAIQALVYDGTNFQMANGMRSGRLINIQVFASAGASTYTPTVGTKAVKVTVVGGGAGGGGSQTTSAGQVSFGGSGAGGGHAVSYLTSGFAGQTVTVGAAGTAGPASGTFLGGAGGSSSFGSLLSATGGQPGGGTGNGAPPQTVGNAQGGMGSGGNLVNGRGRQPGVGSSVSTLFAVNTAGGGSIMGEGGLATGGQIGTAAGNAGSSPGSGGSGAFSGSNTVGQVGGAGAPGIVIIEEYA